jgi:hypothetical protein
MQGASLCPYHICVYIHIAHSEYMDVCMFATFCVNSVQTEMPLDLACLYFMHVNKMSRFTLQLYSRYCLIN